MPSSSPAKLKAQSVYNAKPENVAKRVANNAARSKLIKDGRVKVGDGRDVGHIKSLENGGSNTDANLKVQSTKANRGWRKSASYDPDQQKK